MSKKVKREGIFPMKLHELLSDVERQGQTHIISWLPDGRAFKVHDKKLFAKDIMAAYFGSNIYKSFQRNLNLWGFDTISKGPNKGRCCSPYFLRGFPDLCRGMKRVTVKGPNAKHLVKAHLKAFSHNHEDHQGSRSVSSTNSLEGSRKGSPEPSVRTSSSAAGSTSTQSSSIDGDFLVASLLAQQQQQNRKADQDRILSQAAAAAAAAAGPSLESTALALLAGAMQPIDRNNPGNLTPEQQIVAAIGRAALLQQQQQEQQKLQQQQQLLALLGLQNLGASLFQKPQQQTSALALLAQGQLLSRQQEEQQSLNTSQLNAALLNESLSKLLATRVADV